MAVFKPTYACPLPEGAKVHKRKGKKYINIKDHNGRTVRAFLTKVKLGFPVWLDSDAGNTRRWKVFALPTSFLLDAQGRVRFVLTGPTEWDEGEALQNVESLLAELPTPVK